MGDLEKLNLRGPVHTVTTERQTSTGSSIEKKEFDVHGRLIRLVCCVHDCVDSAKQCEREFQRVVNHPAPNLALVNNYPPAGLNINSTSPFGFIQDKGNSKVMNSEKFRQFRAHVRFSF